MVLPSRPSFCVVLVSSPPPLGGGGPGHAAAPVSREEVWVWEGSDPKPQTSLRFGRKHDKHEERRGPNPEKVEARREGLRPKGGSPKGGGPRGVGPRGVGARRGPQRFHTTAESQTCTLEGPGASNTTKIPREDPQREKKSENGSGEMEKKREILGGPAEGGLAEGGGPAEGGSGVGGPAEEMKKNQKKKKKTKKKKKN